MSNVTLAERYKIMARWCGVPQPTTSVTDAGRSGAVRARPGNGSTAKVPVSGVLTPFFEQVAAELSKGPGVTFQALNDRFFNGRLPRERQKRIKKRLHELYAGKTISTATARELVCLMLCTPDYQMT